MRIPDYGNSENNQLVPWRGGAGAMEAIYFGNAGWHKNRRLGHGPWVGADLEAAMYTNPTLPPNPNPNPH